jgi:CRISPR-associated protein Cas2
MNFVVSYDIPSDERRNKVSKTLKNFGERVQYSVFECQLDPPLFSRMVKALKALIDKEEDSVRIYQLCEGCVAKGLSLGKGGMFQKKDVFIL